jgi:hypothetical protein
MIKNESDETNMAITESPRAPDIAPEAVMARARAVISAIVPDWLAGKRLSGREL